MAVSQDDLRDIMDQAGRTLPYWARSTNPIVRRHLGLGWRTVMPELRPLFIGIAVWGVLIAVGLAAPFVLSMVLMLFIASIMVMPLAALLYAHVLLHVMTRAASTMQAEMNNNTLLLLMTTPMTVEQIFLGKVAAAIWQRMDDLMLIAQTTIVFAPPLLFSMYSSIWSPEQTPVMIWLVLMLALIVSTVRVLLEPIMFGVLSVLIGTLVPGRNSAVTTSVTLGAFYVLVMNVLPLLPGIQGQPLPILIVSFVLPLVLPLALSWLMLWVIRRIVRE